jgi:hypothetical protein
MCSTGPFARVWHLPRSVELLFAAVWPGGIEPAVEGKFTVPTILSVLNVAIYLAGAALIVSVLVRRTMVPPQVVSLVVVVGASIYGHMVLAAHSNILIFDDPTGLKTPLFICMYINIAALVAMTYYSIRLTVVGLTVFEGNPFCAD